MWTILFLFPKAFEGRVDFSLQMSLTKGVETYVYVIFFRLFVSLFCHLPISYFLQRI